MSSMAEASTSASATPAPSTSASAKINGAVVEVTLDSIEDALQAVRAGEILVVVDDMDRENEGDLIIAASQCTTEKMAWIVKWSRWVGLQRGARAQVAAATSAAPPASATAHHQHQARQAMTDSEVCLPSASVRTRAVATSAWLCRHHAWTSSRSRS